MLEWIAALDEEHSDMAALGVLYYRHLVFLELVFGVAFVGGCLLCRLLRHLMTTSQHRVQDRLLQRPRKIGLYVVFPVGHDQDPCGLEKGHLRRHPLLGFHLSRQQHLDPRCHWYHWHR